MELSKPFLPEYRINEPKKKLTDDPAEDNLAPFKNRIGAEIGKGTFATTRELFDSEGNDVKYIMKEGQTVHYSPPILKWLKIHLPREKVSKMLEKIFGPKFKVLPDMEFIKNGLAEYTLIKRYFGTEQIRNSDLAGASAEPESLDEADEIIRQRVADEISDETSEFFHELMKVAGSKDGVARIAEALRKNVDCNFLPKEHLVVGHPSNLRRTKADQMQASGEKLPMTYYIIQEKINGEEVAHLFDMSDDELSRHPKMIEKLLTFLVLAKKMYDDTGRLVDTRPEEFGRNPLEWLRKTGNILVNKKTDDVSFVDTRWLWDKNSRLGEGGINFIKWLGVNSIDRSIKKYTAMLTRIESNQ
jgi:hypothetical protein